MIKDIIAAEEALYAALACKAPPLALLMAPPYAREFRSRETDTKITLQLDKVGFRRYKRHRAPTRKPPVVRTDAIKRTLSDLMSPSFVVEDVTDEGEYITVTVIKI